MKTGDFDYILPDRLIAQNPVFPRDACKLMVYNSHDDTVEHCHFFDLPRFLGANDVLVMNRSKVIPARILFSSNGCKREIFVLKQFSSDSFEVLLRPARSFKLGIWFKIDDDLEFVVEKVLADGRRIVTFRVKSGVNLKNKLFELGSTPLPPYIKRSTASLSDYQTVFASEEGSVAAPTAGLHFTNDLLKKLTSSGVQVEEVLLHIGLGTFAPVVADLVAEHKMHFEEYELSDSVAGRLNSAENSGKRIIAVGTTSVRVLESTYDKNLGFVSGMGKTDIFIYPGSYDWKVVDALITNFHLPKSTLIMLVASFLESKRVVDPVKKILNLYQEAISLDYRFFSFGDAMLII